MRSHALPAAGYGDEVSGLSNSELYRLQATQLAHRPPAHKGCNFKIKLAIWGDPPAGVKPLPPHSQIPH